MANEWISILNSNPEKPGLIFVLINGGIHSAKCSLATLHVDIKDFTNETIMYIIPSKYLPQYGRWIKPQHYGEITHWMYAPEVPNE